MGSKKTAKAPVWSGSSVFPGSHALLTGVTFPVGCVVWGVGSLASHGRKGLLVFLLQWCPQPEPHLIRRSEGRSIFQQPKAAISLVLPSLTILFQFTHEYMTESQTTAISPCIDRCVAHTAAAATVTLSY